MVATIFCVSGEAIAKAGQFVSDALSGGRVSIGSDFIVDVWIKEAESKINVATRQNWSASYTTMSSPYKYILNKAASCDAAIQIINYDMSKYDLAEAQRMQNVLLNEFNSCIEILAKEENQEKIS